MEIARSFLVTVFVWILFATGSIMFLKGEQQMSALSSDWSRPKLFEGAYTGTADLSRMAGEQVLGLVTYAKEGEFVLNLDGLLIDSNTEMDSIDFSGVLNVAFYTLTIARDAWGKTISITAAQ
ncbi:hypothetical protein PAECIP111893_02763 [Paenibacillus plantiphilus]|uniref:Uncharacterized protein n=1 Tax=Paenibacillus plantiphilus TaxID=2905650 RepID=A0ABM9CBU1_9BACL|nr:hypothetical protein [Paenibacillus plantiphilus]CAH1207718.1 hypothetical protein PAECIP111893_02763 [Paenibacillus plantiphilus]